MKIMVIGGGGREHAIIKKLKENESVEEILALPGNGGMKDDATLVPIGAKDLDAICEFAGENKIDYAVVAPDDPLVLGLVDRLEQIGVPCFGPRANAAIIEGSKVFSKNLMKKYGIPTAQYEVFEDAAAALEYVKGCRIPTVVKADGLALGKGVVIAMTRDEAENAVKSIMEDKKFGDSGSRIVVASGWVRVPMMTGSRPSSSAFWTRPWMRLTKGQVASMISTPIFSSRCWTERETPWERMMTVLPGTASSGSEITLTPISSNRPT